MVQWTEAVNVLGFTRAKGSMRRTYEVVASHGCTSYALKGCVYLSAYPSSHHIASAVLFYAYSIPHYKSIILALQEGVTSMAENFDEVRLLF